MKYILFLHILKFITFFNLCHESIVIKEKNILFNIQYCDIEHNFMEWAISPRIRIMGILFNER